MVAKTKLVLGLIFLFILASFSSAAVKTFQVEETELVRIEPEAVDPDQDQIIYSYSPPLDEKGEWLTGYEDAGEYEIVITASDGVEETQQKIKLMVKNKNRPPLLAENRLTVKEDQLVSLKELVEDPDGDPLSFSFTPPFDKNGEWQPGYEDDGSLVASFKVSDGQEEITARLEIEVLPTNHPPVIENSFSEALQVRYSEDETLEFSAGANDVDEDELTYSWKFDGITAGEKDSGEYYLDYESAGEHWLEAIVSDGQLNVSQQWEVLVKNKNRKPEITHLPVTAEEGEKIVLEFPEKDQDGDWLEYSFEAPLDEKGEWLTDYGDAGFYSLEVSASDGELIGKTTLEITILDIDRPPVLTLPKQLEAREGEKLEWTVEADDPDGDELAFTWKGLPEGTQFNEEGKILSWTPSYDFIRRREGRFWNLLNNFRVERFFFRREKISLDVTVCSQGQCLSDRTKLIVYNTNRAPHFTEINDLTIKETETAELKVSAVDPDGDIVHYYFTWPLDRTTGSWKTNYGDGDTYTSYVTATDGRLGETVPIRLKVLKNNRPPWLEVSSDKITVNEGQEFSLNVEAVDPDGDELDVSLENSPFGSSFREGAFTWKPAYSLANKSQSWWSAWVSRSPFLNKKLSPDKAVVWLNFAVSDGEAKTVHPVRVMIKNVNQPPQLIDFLPAAEATVKVNEPVIFHVAVKDEDREKLNYRWSFGWRQPEAKGTDTIERTFSSPGKKKVKVVASDGREQVEKEWVIKVVGETFAAAAEPVPILPPPKEEEIPEQPFAIKVYQIKG